MKTLPLCAALLPVIEEAGGRFTVAGEKLSGLLVRMQVMRAPEASEGVL